MSTISIETCPDTKLRYLLVDDKKYILKEDIQQSLDGAPHSVTKFLNRIGGYDEAPGIGDNEDLESPYKYPQRYDTRPRFDQERGSAWTFRDSEPEPPKVEADPERVSKIQAAEEMSAEELKAMVGDNIPDMNPEPEVLPAVDLDDAEDEDDEGEYDADDEDNYDDEEDDDEDGVVALDEPYDADLSEQAEDLEIVE